MSIQVTRMEPRHIEDVKTIADQNRDALGFNPRKKFEEIAEAKRGLVALDNDKAVGFVTYRHRLIDGQTTLSEICVHQQYREQGIGKNLVCALVEECRQKTREFIQLKCPVDLPANHFYQTLGFKLYAEEAGKQRKLKVWRLTITDSGRS